MPELWINTSLLLFAFLCTILQLYYYNKIFKGFKGYEPPKHSDSPPISVIIAARNEAENLEVLIPAICNQDYSEPFEVIIVNDRSSDSTISLLQKLETTYSNLRTITIHEKPADINGKKYAIEKGIEAASFDKLLLTDADCFPENEHWITTMAAGFSSKKKIVLGFSMYSSKTGMLGAWIYYETLLTALQYIGFTLSGSMPYMGVGRNLGYTKRLFLNQNGFEGFRDLTGGDDDLFVQKSANRSNTSVVIGKSATTWTSPEETWNDYFNQKVRHLSVGRRYSPAIKRKLGLFTLSHIFGFICMGVLLAVPDGVFLALVLWISRTLWVLTTYKKACQKLNMSFFSRKILLMDLLFPVYFLVIGSAVFFSKKIQWK